MSGIMEFAVMKGTEGDGKFVRDLAAHGGCLGELQVMGVGGLASADETGVAGDEAKMGGIANAPGLGAGEGGLVDMALWHRGGEPSR